MRCPEAESCKAFIGAESHGCMFGTRCQHREFGALGMLPHQVSRYRCFCEEMQLQRGKVQGAFELTSDILILVHFHSGAGSTLKH